MKKLILAVLTLSATLIGSGLQANETYEQTSCLQGNQPCEQVNEGCVQEQICNVSEDFSFAEENFCVDTGYYVSGIVGINFLNKNGQAGFTGGISGGYKFQNNFRVEGEVAYRYHRLRGLNVNTYSFMANGLYDLPQICQFTPYIGFGLGFAHTNSNVYSRGYSLSKLEDDFVMQGIFGASRKLNNGLHAGVEYRIFGTEHHVYDHSIVVSLKRFI